jgi:protease II
MVINQNTEPNLLGFQYPYWWTDNAVYHVRSKQKIVDLKTKTEKIFKVFLSQDKNIFFFQTITNQIVKLFSVIDGIIKEVFSPETGGRLSHLKDANFIWFPPNKLPSKIEFKKNISIKKQIEGFDFSKEIKYDYVILKRNGAHIPVTTIKPTGKIKGLLAYVYGYYGTPTPIHLSPRWIAWVRAGFAVSFIGVRGGGDNGFEGWDSARGNERKVGILDYISAVSQLQYRFSIKPEKTILFGRSAAGMTVGSVLTLIDNPRKFCGAVWGEAPYVDVVKGCLNHQVPVAPLERDEFFPVINYDGFRIAEELDPTLRLPKGPSVPVLATGGLHDSEVMPWEPMKWCLRLREKNWKHVACRIDKQTGHFMAGEYAYDKFAEDSAFLLSAIGLDLDEK